MVRSMHETSHPWNFHWPLFPVASHRGLLGPSVPKFNYRVDGFYQGLLNTALQVLPI